MSLCMRSVFEFRNVEMPRTGPTTHYTTPHHFQSSKLIFSYRLCHRVGVVAAADAVDVWLSSNATLYVLARRAPMRNVLQTYSHVCVAIDSLHAHTHKHRKPHTAWPLLRRPGTQSTHIPNTGHTIHTNACASRSMRNLVDGCRWKTTIG